MDKIKCRFIYSRSFVVVVLSIIFVLLLSFFIFGSPFYVNNSPSAPTGIYRIVFETKPVLQKGDMVVIHSPFAFPAIHLDKNSVLLKKVAGTCGDTFEVNDYALVLHGKAYPINHTYSYLPHLPLGTYTVREDMVLLLNDMDLSLDSRYFGPLPKDLVIHRVKLLMSFKDVDDFLIAHLPDWLLFRLLGYVPESQVVDMDFVNL